MLRCARNDGDTSRSNSSLSVRPDKAGDDEAGRSCFASTASRSRGLVRPSFALNLPPSPIRGRGECRVPNAPAASCALWGGRRLRTSIHSGSTGIIRHPPRDGLRLIPRSPRGPLALLTPSSARRVGVVANLTPAKGRQNHTASPSANRRARQSHHSRPPHPAPRT